MAKYLYLFRGGEENMAALSPEETQEHMQKWGAWMQGLAENGKLIDGLPLNKSGKVVEQRESWSTTDLIPKEQKW